MANMLQYHVAQNQALAQKSAYMEDSVRQSKKVIKELNARANGIQCVPASEPKAPGRRGGLPGSLQP